MASAREEAINPEQLCGAWNETFKDLNMRVNDLSHPTEAFITRALVYYLREFGYIVEPPFPLHQSGGPSEKTRAKRLFLVVLARHIDHIVQISVKTLYFTYYDIVKPSPKKTNNVLEVLYNYLCYFNMFQKEVVKIAEEQLKKLEELTSEVEEIKRETEHQKLITEELNAKIENATKQINIMKPHLAAQLAEKRKLEALLKKLIDNNKKIEQQLVTENAENQHWEKLIVSDDEVRDLKKKMKKLQIEIDNSKLEIIKEETELKEREAIIAMNKELHTLIEQTLEILPRNILTDHKEGNKQLERTVRKYKALELNRKELQHKINRHKLELELLQQKRQISKINNEPEEKNQQEELKKQKNILNEKKTELDALKDDEQELVCRITEQECIEQYVEESSRELFATYIDKPHFSTC